MRRALLDMRPDRFEDIIALVALYRPGPMANIPTYCARKHGREKPEYIHPKLEPVLRETFGVIVYQEQVMQAAQLLAGYTLGQADLLRRAMGKKIRSEMQAQRKRLRRRRDRARDRARAGRRDLRSAGALRRIRLQQEPRRRLRAGRLSDRLHEGELSGRVPGGVDDARHGQHRQALGIPRRGRAARHQGRAALDQPFRRRPSRSTATRSTTRWPRSRASARRRSTVDRRARRATSRSPTSPTSRAASIRAPSTSACWKASPPRARSTRSSRNRARAFAAVDTHAGDRAAQPRGGVGRPERTVRRAGRRREDHAARGRALAAGRAAAAANTTRSASSCPAIRSTTMPRCSRACGCSPGPSSRAR